MKNLPKTGNKDNVIKGQAILLVLLGIAVVLTLVLSIVSRSITDIAVTESSEESLRAFSAAEAGVERLLIGSIGDSEGNPGDPIYATVSGYGALDEVHYPAIKSGESVTVWFVSHEGDNLSCNPNCFGDGSGDEIKVCWGTSSNNSQRPAVEISFYYDTDSMSLGSNPSYGGVRVNRVAYDPVWINRRQVNKFTNPTGGACTIKDENGVEVDYRFSTDIAFTASFFECNLGTGCQPLFAKVKSLYNTTAQQVGVEASGTSHLPAQGKLIESTGTSGDATRRIEAYQSFSEPLSIFEAAVFSGTSLVK